MERARTPIARVYNYKKGKREKSVRRLIIGKFCKGYLCVKGNPNKVSDQMQFQTEWFSFIDKIYKGNK